MGIRIVTDSTSYLPAEVLEEYGIEVVPLQIRLGDLVFREGFGPSNAEYYARMRSVKLFPTTSQPSSGDFLEVFRKFDRDDAIICIVISQALSGTAQSAQVAAELLPEYDITVIDSLSTVMGLGFQVLRAAEMARQGSDKDQIVQEVLRIRDLVKVLFVVDDLEYLIRGGRLSKAGGLVGTILQIKPILHITEGRIEVFEKVRTTNKAISRVLEVFREDVQKGKVSRVCVEHVDDLRKAELLKKEVEAIFDGPIMVAEAGPTIGSHVGPGAAGIVYY